MGSHLTWLTHHSTAGPNGRSYLEGEEVDGEVPGGNEPSHPDGGTARIVGGTCFSENGGAVEGEGDKLKVHRGSLLGALEFVAIEVQQQPCTDSHWTEAATGICISRINGVHDP